MSIEDIVRGPNELVELNVDGWPILQGKSSGITPGYRLPPLRYTNGSAVPDA